MLQELEKGNIPLERLARHFEAHNRSEGKSPRTIEWYCRVLRYFQSYLEDEGYSTNLNDITLTVVKEFIVYLQTRNKWNNHPFIPHPEGKLAAISVQNYVRGIRAFFSWLHREGYTEENLLGQLKPPKFPQKLIEVLKDEEVTRILACIGSDTSAGCRDIAMIITFLDSGLRLSELTNIQICDAHIDEGYLKAMGKGAKERFVPIGNTAQKVLLKYVFQFRPDPLYGGYDYLFLTLDGRPMSSNCVKQIFARLAQKSGINRFHVHLCRHTFATNYLINGGDVFSLQQILGHASLEMVKRYVTLASAHVKVQHKKFSPMDRMSIGSGIRINTSNRK